MRHVSTAGLFLLVALSACLSNPPPTDCGLAACPPTSGDSEYFPAPPGSPFPPLPVNESLRSMRLEDCTGVQIVIDLPEGATKDQIPPGFEPVDFPDGTANIIGDALHCERAVFPNAILTDYYEIRISPKVWPKNESWATGGASFLVWDYYTNSPVATGFLNAWGFAARTASFDVQRIVTAAATRESWTIVENDTRFEFEFIQTVPPLETVAPRNANNRTVFVWAGTDPYLKAMVSQRFVDAANNDHGLFHATGTSKTRAAMTADYAPWEGFPYVRLDQSFLVYPELYEANA